MENPTGESSGEVLRLDFDRRLWEGAIQTKPCEPVPGNERGSIPETAETTNAQGHPPSLSNGGLGLGIFNLARTSSQSSGESHVMNELFLSRSAWLIESHWSSCRLPGKTNSSA